MSSLILIVDDEPAIRRLLRASLGAEGFRTEETENGRDTLARLRAAPAPDLAVLDLGLPDIEGLDLVREIRSFSAVPIVVLSAREDERGKVAALELGADDYVTKPFGMAELIARIRTGLRHRLAQEGAQPVFRSGELAVDLVRRLVTVGGREVHLSPREYDILKLMVLHAGRVLTHRFILGKLWGASGDVQQLRVYVRQIRQKIETSAEQPRYILTETGVGYRLAVLDEI
jgi:two-component system, OmpR family, KDP operon response regulator KdpE